MNTSVSKDYKFVLKIGNKQIKFRKWKVKDKKKYINSTNTEDDISIKEAIVYDCIDDKNIVLSEDEFRYALINIRAESVKTALVYNFECSSCENAYEFVTDVKDVVKPVFEKYKPIAVVSSDTSYNIELGELCNRKFYEETMLKYKNEVDIADFVLHIQSFNGDVSLTFDEIINIINEMDIDAFDKIFQEWVKTKFKLNMVSTVMCPHCNHEEQYLFDEFPGFFPSNWKTK